MWDFSFEIPSLLLLGSILVYYFSGKRIPVRRGRMFLLSIFLCVFCAATNMLGSMYDVGIIRSFPGHMGTAMNYVYYCSYMLRFFAVTLYFFIDLGLADSKKVRLWTYTAAVIAEIWTMFAVANHFFYYEDETGLHLTEGYRLLDLLTVIAAGLQLSAVLYACHKRKKVRAMFTLTACIGLEIVIAVCNTFLPNLLISDPMYMTMILYILIAIENPAIYRKPGTNTFNTNGFTLMLQSGELDRWFGTAVMLDNYKHVRSIYSSSAFDDSLREIEKYLERSKDTFVFSLHDGLLILMTKQPSDPVIERLIERSKKPWKSDDLQVYYDFSFLKLLSHDLPKDTDEFIDYVKGELGRVGKNEIRELDREDIEQLHRQNRIRNLLNSSINHSSVQMFLQPIVNAGTGKMEGAEALARLYDPENGRYISPAEFIPLAEESGLILSLGSQMLEKACEYLKQNPDLPWINVNVSPTQFADRNFLSSLSELADRSKIRYDRLRLEITEEAYITDDVLTQKISLAHDQKYQVVLDDYGSGYSSLSRVIQNPFSNIKLDMNFVWESLKGERNILPELIHAFHKLGYTVTAEGVETEKMKNRLSEYGCDYFQGYLYSKPVPPDEFREIYGAADSEL